MPITRDAIVDAALAEAERTSWEALRLHQVAAALSIGLNDVRAHFREKEDIVDAWFDRADSAMLADGARLDEYRALSARQRVERALMAWLGALAAHRRVTRQMIWNKLEPGHLHYQWSGLLRVSRTVQWLREAAGREAVFPRRAIEESALTALYLATFLYWMYDDSLDAVRTRAFLSRRLDRAERVARLLRCSRAEVQPSRYP